MGSGAVSSPRTPRIAPGTRCDPALSTALAEFAAAAVRNDEIDPVTTELVRLRCAAYHDCHT